MSLRERVTGLVERMRGRRGAEKRWEAADARITCECGEAYRLVGTGRHRIIWPADGDQREALTSSECRSCGRPLEV